MRGRTAKLLRSVSLRLAAMTKLPAVTWTAKRHADRRITEGYTIETWQILLGECARKLYKAMKRSHKCRDNHGQNPKASKAGGGYRTRIKRKQQVNHMIPNSRVGEDEKSQLQD